MLHIVSLARYAAVYTRSWAADSTNQRVRLKAENDRAQQELALLREDFAGPRQKLWLSAGARLVSARDLAQ